MNETQQTAMKVEPMPFPKPGDANAGAAVNEMMKQNHKKLLQIITEGVGAIRAGTYSGHDAQAIAELQIFLKNVSADLRQQITGKVEPAATFEPQPQVPA